MKMVDGRLKPCMEVRVEEYEMEEEEERERE
jgi:hypothetical protein